MERNERLEAFFAVYCNTVKGDHPDCRGCGWDDSEKGCSHPKHPDYDEVYHQMLEDKVTEDQNVH